MESNISTLETMKDIVNIAMLLRDKGDRILNFSCKLSLTMDFLVNLNEAFDLIVDNVESPSFQVINTNNSSIEFLHDLQFLHDFVQKVLCLRLTSKTPIFERKVRLGKFRALCFLDLYEVPIESIGICSTRSKLKSLICRRCRIRDLNNLFEPEGFHSFGSDSDDSENEARVKRTWLCLEEVFLPHNDIEFLGYYLRYVPKLRILDISYNNLTDISALDKNIDNLEWLNVSFNHLQTIPTFTQCTKLKTLLISDNRIQDLKGLCRILSLQHVDASRNLIKRHSSLTSLVNLKCLEKLQLEGNPCAFRRGHRLLTIANLNPWVLTSQIFFLDGIPLSSLEKSHFLPKQPLKHYKESVEEVNISDHCCCSHSHSTRSSSCHQQQCVAQVQQPKNLQNAKKEIATTSRATKIREAPIAEGEECQLTGSLENQVDTSSLSMAGSTTHKDTKRDIESLRKAFGEENWLQGGGGRMILDILGLRLGPANSSSSVASLPESLVVEGTDLAQDKPISGAEEFAEQEDGEEGKEGLLEADVKEAAEEEVEESESIGENREEVENGVELGIFVVQKKRIKGDCVTMDDLLLVVTDRFLAECDVTNGSVVAKWDLCRLQRVIHNEKENDGIKGTEVVVTFKETWEMPEECSYLLDDMEAKELVGIVEGILDVTQATVAESALLFMCVKCSSNFFGTSPSNTESFSIEEEKAVRGQIPKCPKCGSVVVVHADSIEEKASSPADDVLTSAVVAVAEAGPHRKFSLEKAENKNPFTFWSKSNLSSSMKANTEASDRGLQLYVLLNCLPDGMGKENDLNIHEAVIFKEGSEEYFLGHIVLSTDSIYVLRREAAAGSKVSEEGKSLSSDESSEPILVEWHPLSNCSAITRACSGYFFQFGPSPPSCLWIFPRHQEEMQRTLDSLSNTLKDLQCFESIEEQTKAPRKLGEVLIAAPILAFSSHFSDSSRLDHHDPFSSPEIEHGVLILTPTIISVIDYKDLQLFRTDFDYIPSCSKRISDLVGLDAAPYSILQLPGVIFHFSGESDEDTYALWPWGEEALFNLVETLRKPWENLFSIPLEAIVAQTLVQGN